MSTPTVARKRVKPLPAMSKTARESAGMAKPSIGCFWFLKSSAVFATSRPSPVPQAA